jgi:hypothetical protein
METLSAVFMARTKLEIEQKERQRDRLRRFHIHGWRWHQAALVRDAKRFEQAARSARCGRNSDPCSVGSLDEAARWLLDANLRDFRIVQDKLFMPFLRKHLPDETITPISRAVERHDQSIRLLEQQLREELAACRVPAQCNRHRQRLEHVATRLSQLLEQAYASEQSLVIAAVAERIPIGAQRAFEERVRHHLNAEQKRLHIVSFYEAIKDDPEELARFRALLPAPVRLLLGSWRRRWYAPATRSLDRCNRLGTHSRCTNVRTP